MGLVEATIKEYRAADLKGTKDDRDVAYRNAVKAGDLRLRVEAILGELIKMGQEESKRLPSPKKDKRGFNLMLVRNLTNINALMKQ